MKIPVQGGPPSTICTTDGLIAGASWGDDDTIVFGTRENSSGLFRVPAAGGEAEPLTTPNEAGGTHRWPTLLPGSDAVLFNRGAGIALLDLQTGTMESSPFLVGTLRGF